ncbi:MAG: dTDP-4-dehydrorhamnose 3,5-epimerase [Chitinispirillaceae bacterium]|jgi:dTDP-4-dehydrorhamnose 3,5-epimerase|nr:dTDP-4-dehydrorhamnose 3,5-epimerase [Chitinispirillaceae bacterium]
MEFVRTDLADVILVKPDVHADHRGFFLESYSKKLFSDNGIADEFVQDNHSCSLQRPVLRGLHFQRPPFTQSKLIRVIRGSIWDVVIDLRKSSPTFMKWNAFELSGKNFHLLYVPMGFAHGFCTLEEDTEVEYKVNKVYAPAHDGGIRWNDPDLAVTWPITKPILSQKDEALPFLRDMVNPF